MNQDQGMVETLIRVIAEAAARVHPSYLKIVTTYDLDGITREKVFCYELYHQMRLILGEITGITLNGEIDKSGHHNFESHHQKNPDFVFHVPGEWKENSVVVEVKGGIDRRNKIQEDFEKLLTFTNLYGYKAGVFLLYNHHKEELKNGFLERVQHFATENNFATEPIHVITLPEAGTVEGPFKFTELLTM
jgi:hypothetical protein